MATMSRVAIQHWLGDAAKSGEQVYQTLDQKLGKRDEVTIANNTMLRRVADDEIAVVLHWTRVLTFRANNTVVIRTGGWQTTTTLARINLFFSCYLPTVFRLYQHNWELCIASTSHGQKIENGRPFQEGMVVDLDTGIVTTL